MDKRVALFARRNLPLRRYVTSTAPAPILDISDGTFYRHHPSSIGRGTSALPNPPLFSNLTWQLPSFSSGPEYWSIVGPSSSGKTTFLQVIRGQHLCFPPTARSYPHLSSDEIERKNHQLRNPSTAIQYVGFGGEQGELGTPQTSGAYLSARYESRREKTDFSVLNYLQGRTQLNMSEEFEQHIDERDLARVVKDLRLDRLIDMPVSNLSNGQTRRAKIAKALLGKPEVLLLDEPFMGLDPPTLMTLSPLLHSLAKANEPRLVLTLRPQDPIPDWISHVMYLRPHCEIAFAGPKDEVLEDLKQHADDIRHGKAEPDVHMPVLSMREIGRELTNHGIMESNTAEASSDVSSPMFSREGDTLHDSKCVSLGEPIVEMRGVRVAYGQKTVLGAWKQDVDGENRDGLWWTVRRGQRWGIFGPNGSGKTTILSLICSDHPQTYSLPIQLFGRSRLPEPGKPGISIFDLQRKMGHSSPEIHHHIPRRLTLRQTLENSWADTFLSKAHLDNGAKSAVNATLRWFEPELRPDASTTAEHQESTAWADELIFGGLPFSTQRLALFLRAILKKPDLVILDEAFSGMDDAVRDKCMLFLAHGESKTFAYGGGQDAAGQDKLGERKVIESNISKAGQVKVTGLEEDQALLCISHIREEIPGCVREWICLPEPNEGMPARFGRLDGPLEGDYRRWNEIWAM
ncbi:MAG: hypothetical protein M1818_001158 [Claussenomyces sp. TS43310]|nr:MAG: hypothetical protein M1818_001158 [Claussenomyces sp. TS43310]